jgi:cytochrome c-type biogenesis protein CcmF
VLISSAIYLFFTAIRDFFSKKNINISQKISHFGFSLLILSILLNNLFSSEIITNIKVGEKFIFKKGTIEFKSIKNVENKNYNSIIGHFKIEYNNKNWIILRPELRIYDQPVIITSEADIKTTFFSDNFLVMNLVKGNEYFNIRYQVKQFMIWIWISTLLVVMGGIFSLFLKKNEK